MNKQKSVIDEALELYCRFTDNEANNFVTMATHEECLEMDALIEQYEALRKDIDTLFRNNDEKYRQEIANFGKGLTVENLVNIGYYDEDADPIWTLGTESDRALFNTLSTKSAETRDLLTKKFGAVAQRHLTENQKLVHWYYLDLLREFFGRSRNQFLANSWKNRDYSNYAQCLKHVEDIVELWEEFISPWRAKYGGPDRQHIHGYPELQPNNAPDHNDLDLPF